MRYGDASFISFSSRNVLLSHEEAEVLGFFSKSDGDNDERHIKVYKSGFEPPDEVVYFNLTL